MPGVDLAAARRIVTAHWSPGFFTSVERLGEAGLSTETLNALSRMSEAMKNEKE